ncbi:AraC family transcriptional regulator [Dethiosulfatarculus sandiegensis]|uniref:AraC family transcriptional regulator n=1 Tax=Dethiosulfatarculus sandiegensis TaxID=1429043 RepID=A0A0D2JC40_9BACT|nr:GyrI-like domain-containing protein [Dethiosulfatarculus sandiegensis]KIX13336.1 AraC family transcriptional regulator [Dethiosulfatarculus sandiegensis]
MRDATKRDYAARMLRVLIHIQENLEEDPDLDELARVACFSPFHFHRIFKGMVGETVRQHVRRLRLERAAFYLRRTPDFSVTEIAFQAGYETLESFSRAFYGMFKITPSRWRAWRGAIFPRYIPAELYYNPLGHLTGFEPILYKGDEMDAKIMKIPARRVAFVRHVGPYHKCQPAWEKLCKWAESKGFLTPETLFIGLSHDDPEITPIEKLRYDACITVGLEIAPEEEIGVQEIPEGDYALYLQTGPLELIPEGFGRLVGKWLPTQGREIKPGPCVEVYLDDPDQVPPKDLRIELQVPLEPK